MASNLNKQENPLVRPASLKTDLAYEDMSPLGKTLHDIADEIEHSDEPAFNENDIEKELEERRGGHSHNDENSHIH
jgi:hypothetical protein